MDEFSHMDQDERRDLFLRATDALMDHGKKLQSIANRMYRIDPTIYKKGPEKFYKRIRNIRTVSLGVYPGVKELQLLFEAYPDELSVIRGEIGQPSPLEREVSELKKEVRLLKQWVREEKLLKSDEDASREELTRKIKKKRILVTYESTSGESKYNREPAFFHRWGENYKYTSDGDQIQVTVAIVELVNSGQVMTVNPDHVKFLSPEQAVKAKERFHENSGVKIDLVRWVEWDRF